MAIGTVPLFQGLPVWNPVLRSTFGWSASQMSWAFAMTRIEGGLLGPVEGLLVERLGSRRMVFIGMSILGGGFILLSQIHALWQLYLAFGIMSVGAALGTWLPMMTVMNHWFIRSKTRAMSIAMEGYALGGMTLPLCMAWAIGGVNPDISERFGWRVVALGIGIFIMAASLPLSRLVRNRPEELGLSPDGRQTQPALTHAKSNPPTDELEGYTWQEAMMSYVETTTERFRGVTGLQRVRLVHCIEPQKTPRMFSSAIFDNRTSAEAAQENMRAIMAGMDEFIIDDPSLPGVAQFEKNVSVREGEVIWSHYR